MRIARVVEVPAPEPSPQAVELQLRRQIGFRIARQDLVEEPHVLGDLSRILLVRGSRQDDAPATRSLLAQIREDLIVVGENGSIQIDLICDVLLELRSTAAQPEQRADRAKRAGLHQTKKRFEQDVRPDQRSIEVHAQRYRVGPATHVVHRLRRLKTRSGITRINSMIGRQNHGR